jgi:hypothetical protein
MLSTMPFAVDDLNLSDGVVGVDSALTVSDTEQIFKVFENSEKLF